MHCLTQGGTLAAIALFALSSLACSKQGTPQGRRTATRQVDARRSGVRAKRYSIRFDRPEKMGARYKLELSGIMDTESVLDGKAAGTPSNTTRFTYVAEVTVKALHPCGKTTREVHKVIKAQQTRAGNTQVVVPAGPTRRAEGVRSTKTFTNRGKPVSATVATFLKYVVTLFNGDTNSLDDIYDPERPRAVGETWNVNGARMLAGLKKSVKNIATWPKLSEVRGTVTLVAVRRLKGVEMLELKAEIQMPNMAPRMRMMTVKSAIVAYTNTFLIPADPQVRAVSRMGLTMQIHLECSTSISGKPSTLVINVLQGLRVTVSPLPFRPATAS